MAEDIAAFLRARYDKRQLVLLNVGPARVAWATFLNPDGSMRYTSVASANGDVWVCDGHVVEPDSVRVVFDRDQELADIAAKRRIVELHRPVGMTTCNTCHSGWTAELDPADFPCDTLKLLALPYAGHPEYRAEWRP